jgi:hypothetical protein
MSDVAWRQIESIAVTYNSLRVSHSLTVVWRAAVSVKRGVSPASKTTYGLRGYGVKLLEEPSQTAMLRVHAAQQFAFVEARTRE